MAITPDMNALVRDYHAAFCGTTGINLRIGIGEYNREAAWFRIIQAGFTLDDVQLVSRHLMRKVKEGTRNIGAVRFSNLIERPDVFEEELGMARAELRNSKSQPTAKQRVLQQARPTIVPMTPDQTQNTAKPVSAYIDALRKAAR